MNSAHSAALASAPPGVHPQPHPVTHRGYEVELPQNTGLDQYSTGDIWATVYRGDSVQQGDDVGFDCTDRALENVYAQGPLDTVNGSDIVLWLAIRHHHEPRFDGEEAEYLPYHYEEFHLT